MSKIAIRRIGIFKSSIRLKEPFIISLGKLEFAENIIVEIQDSTGRKGFGEGSPFRTIHGETIGTCFSVGSEIAKLLVGKNPCEPEECGRLMDKFIFGNTTIKSAFDIALHDLASQHADMPLHKFLGAKAIHKLQTDYTISLGPVEKMCRDAEKIVNAGFRVVKVKLGESPALDIERIRCIREMIGMEIPLRIDANQGWTSSNALEILIALNQYQIQHCEEPIPRHEFMHLAELKRKSPIPIMADESCFDHHDALRLVSLKSCSSFNIKLGKSSGINKAMKIMQIAETEQMPIQIGGFLESRLGFTAAAHVAQCCAELPFIDFDTPLMFSEDFVRGGITYDNNGFIRMPEGPGLGASFNEDYLNSLENCYVNDKS